jgi:hypothetical protein
MKEETKGWEEKREERENNGKPPPVGPTIATVDPAGAWKLKFFIIGSPSP